MESPPLDFHGTTSNCNSDHISFDSRNEYADVEELPHGQMCGSGRSSSSKRSESLRPHSSPSHRLDSGPDIEDNHVSTMTKQVLTRALILLLAYQSIGVVYGDIGTSPLYVFNSTFPEGIKERDDVLGALSLIFYTLTLIPLLKYISIVLYANDNGEGGTFALYSLICRHANLSLIPNQQMEDQTVSMYNLLTPSRKLNRAMKLKDAMERSYIAKTGLLLLTILGTSMVIGDGILTPSISVLSAVNGIQEATPNLGKEHVVMISVAILVIIFMIQRVGAAKIGFMFAPAVLLWFGLIASIGLYNILKHDAQIFHAWNPKYIYVYFERNKREGWVSLGGIVLSITGTEAMFADVGHFSVASIQIAFTLLVYPCLLLAYAGQAAYLIHHTNDVDQAFYKSVPAPLYWPMFVVALCAAIVASQAMISATFTIVKQACSFGSFPRVKVLHTSTEAAGQVYIPEMNWVLMICCISVTAYFQSPTKLGNAYGIAVVGVMVVTTCLITIIMILVWQLHLVLIISFVLVFGTIDLLYFSSVLYKFEEGGYLPLAFAAILLFVMCVWHYVYTKRYLYEVKNRISTEYFLELLSKSLRVSGVGLVYTELVQGIPRIVSHMMESLPALHSVMMLVTVKYLPVNTVLKEERFVFWKIGSTEYHMYRCIARYGYKDAHEDTDTFQRDLLAGLANFISCGRQSGRLEEIRQGRETGGLATNFVESVDGRGESISAEEKTKAVWESVTSCISTASNNNDTAEAGIENMENLSSPTTGLVTSTGRRRGLALRHWNKAVEAGTVLEELKFLEESVAAGVIYFLGHLDVRAGRKSSFIKKFVVNYAYQFLRHNCRSGSSAVTIPHEQMLEIGMIYDI